MKIIKKKYNYVDSNKINQYPWGFNRMLKFKRRKWLRKKYNEVFTTGQNVKAMRKKFLVTYKLRTKLLFKKYFASKMTERQFKKLFRSNIRYKATFYNIIKTEHRLDTIIFRLFLFSTIFQVRSLIKNNFFIVNNLIQNTPGFILNSNDIIKPSNYYSFNLCYNNILNIISSTYKYLNRIFNKYSYPFIIKKILTRFREGSPKLGKPIRKIVRRVVKNVIWESTRRYKLKYTPRRFLTTYLGLYLTGNKQKHMKNTSKKFKNLVHWQLMKRKYRIKKSRYVFLKKKQVLKKNSYNFPIFNYRIVELPIDQYLKKFNKRRLLNRWYSIKNIYALNLFNFKIKSVLNKVVSDELRNFRNKKLQNRLNHRSKKTIARERKYLSKKKKILRSNKILFNKEKLKKLKIKKGFLFWRLKKRRRFLKIKKKKIFYYSFKKSLKSNILFFSELNFAPKNKKLNFGKKKTYGFYPNRISKFSVDSQRKKLCYGLVKSINYTHVYHSKKIKLSLDFAESVFLKKKKIKNNFTNEKEKNMLEAFELYESKNVANRLKLAPVSEYIYLEKKRQEEERELNQMLGIYKNIPFYTFSKQNKLKRFKSKKEYNSKYEEISGNMIFENLINKREKKKRFFYKLINSIGILNLKNKIKLVRKIKRSKKQLALKSRSFNNHLKKDYLKKKRYKGLKTRKFKYFFATFLKYKKRFTRTRKLRELINRVSYFRRAKKRKFLKKKKFFEFYSLNQKIFNNVLNKQKKKSFKIILKNTFKNIFKKTFKKILNQTSKKIVNQTSKKISKKTLKITSKNTLKITFKKTSKKTSKQTLKKKSKKKSKKTVNQISKNSVDLIPKNIVNRISINTVNKISKNIVNKISKNTINKTSKNTVNQISKNIVNQIPEKTVNKISKNIVNQFSKNSVNQNSTNTVSQISKNIINQTSENIVNKIFKNIVNKNSKNIVNKIFKNTVKRISKKTFKKIVDQIPKNIINQISKNSVNQTSKKTLKKKSKKTLKNKSKKTSKKTLKNTLKKTSKKTLKKKSKSIPKLLKKIYRQTKAVKNFLTNNFKNIYSKKTFKVIVNPIKYNTLNIEKKVNLNIRSFNNLINKNNNYNFILKKNLKKTKLLLRQRLITDIDTKIKRFPLNLTKIRTRSKFYWASNRINKKKYVFFKYTKKFNNSYKIFNNLKINTLNTIYPQKNNYYKRIPLIFLKKINRFYYKKQLNKKKDLLIKIKQLKHGKFFLSKLKQIIQIKKIFKFLSKLTLKFNNNNKKKFLLKQLTPSQKLLNLQKTFKLKQIIYFDNFFNLNKMSSYLLIKNSLKTNLKFQNEIKKFNLNLKKLKNSSNVLQDTNLNFFLIITQKLLKNLINTRKTLKFKKLIIEMPKVIEDPKRVPPLTAKEKETILLNKRNSLYRYILKATNLNNLKINFILIKVIFKKFKTIELKKYNLISILFKLKKINIFFHKTFNINNKNYLYFKKNRLNRKSLNVCNNKKIIMVKRFKRKYLKLKGSFFKFKNLKIKLEFSKEYNKILPIQIKYKKIDLLFKHRPICYYFIETNYNSLIFTLLNDVDFFKFPYKTFLDFKTISHLYTN